MLYQLSYTRIVPPKPCAKGDIYAQHNSKKVRFEQMFCYTIFMHRSKAILILGFLVAVLPALGFPRTWEEVFQVLAGLSIIGFSVWSTIDKKLSLKAKAQLRQARRSVPIPVLPTSSDQVTPEATLPYTGRRVTDFYPKTGQPGRRTRDLHPTSGLSEDIDQL